MSNYADITNYHNAIQRMRSRVYRDDPEVQEAINTAALALKNLMAEMECSIARWDIDTAEQQIAMARGVIAAHKGASDAES